MNQISSAILDFSLPQSFIVHIAQTDVLSAQSAVSLQPRRADAPGIIAVNNHSLFTVEERDFAEMSKFTSFAKELTLSSKSFLQRVWNCYCQSVMNMVFTYEEFQKAKKSLLDGTEQIYNCSINYRNLCQDIKRYCEKMDGMTAWYIRDSNAVLSHLNDVISKGNKYGKVTEIFEKCGKDIGILTFFFERWTNQAKGLAASAQQLENQYMGFYDFFQNELDRQINLLARNMDQLIGFIHRASKHQPTYQYDGTMASALLYIFDKNRDLTEAIQYVQNFHDRVAQLAVRNMFNYLGHIGTYFNALHLNIASAKKEILNAEGIESVFALHTALNHAKEAWEASKKCSDAYVEASSKYVV